MQTGDTPRGVHLTRNAAGAITDVQLDPQEFDGPDGVPEGWSRTMDTTMNRAWHGVLGYALFLFGLLLFCVGAWAALIYGLSRLF